MKNKYYFLPVLLCLLAVACSKKSTPPEGVEGKWLLIKAEGGISGGAHEITNRQEAIFAHDTFRLIINGLQVRATHYRLETAPGDNTWKLITNDSTFTNYITIKPYALVFTDDMIDGMTLTYKRE
ncbi:hypothetical protein [Chitinophaga sp. Ak27]|uniref:hypothetical protein n=1 Tax=Chitinophaga sp. Ak27 TaxID=2726116 RepID=UPI00145E2970|nr:hypothetical protein [Chitinophaga sp. Ak27]NLU92797.1 hypothetical protein [Chitinophaga sp. Ak27]